MVGGLLALLTHTDTPLERADADRPEYGEVMQVPDTEALAERLRCCLEEGDPVPADITTLFDHGLYSIRNDLVPSTVALYEMLGIVHAPLGYLPPRFEAPTPPLQPAVFLPQMREPAPPALELYDLDQALASERVLLAELTNKCDESDLAYFVTEGGELLGVCREIREAANEEGLVDLFSGPSPGAETPDTLSAPVPPLKIMEYILAQLVRYKKLEQDPADY
jgi:intraflagellar transport protein 52